LASFQGRLYLAWKGGGDDPRLFYFESKEGLYDAVFLDLIDRERPFWLQASDLSFRDWFAALFRDYGVANNPWIRLMALEGLADEEPDTAIREAERGASLRQAISLVTKAQTRGEVTAELDADLLALALILWTIAPRLLPQLTRMVTGLSPHDPLFLERLRRFNEALAELMQPRAFDSPED
jgi:AcrR family transcriptional regulator